jgi:hypothetical protein
MKLKIVLTCLLIRKKIIGKNRMYKIIYGGYGKWGSMILTPVNVLVSDRKDNSGN